MAPLYRILITVMTVISVAFSAQASRTPVKHERPDLDKIEAETLNPSSPYYYKKLMASYQSNDTVMGEEEFKYLYYGALFQDNYNPYPHIYNEARLKELEPLYSKSQHSRAECTAILEFAREALAHNPFNLRQLNFLVYAYEKLGKINLAKIWQNKLNHLLLTIASSGTGVDPENAWTVVLTSNEYDFLNLSGMTATGQKFQEPYYDYISVAPKKDGDPQGYYFNIEPILKEYYKQHPNEL